MPRREALEGRTRLKEEHEIFSKTRVYGARAGNTQVFFLTSAVEERVCGFCDHTVARVRRSTRM